MAVSSPTAQKKLQWNGGNEVSEWASGIVDVMGTRSAITSFLERFLYAEDEQDAEPSKRYFARSILYASRNGIRDELDSVFSDVGESDEREFRVYPEFAWSAAYCLVGPYVMKYPQKCVGLAAACVEDQVDVLIRTKATSGGFQELIQCNRCGALICQADSLHYARCKSCGGIESMADFETLSDLECSECGRTEFELSEEM